MQNNKKMILCGLLSALGVSLYTLLISYILNNGQKWFGSAKGVLAPMVLLMLLVLSMAIVGALLFGRPGYLMMNDNKSGAIKQLIYNLSWQAIITIVFFILLAIFK